MQNATIAVCGHNDINELDMFLFEDMEDFRNRSKDVDAQYMKTITAKKKNSGEAIYVPPIILKPEPKPPVVILDDIVGNWLSIRHLELERLLREKCRDYIEKIILIKMSGG